VLILAVHSCWTYTSFHNGLWWLDTYEQLSPADHPVSILLWQLMLVCAGLFGLAGLTGFVLTLVSNRLTISRFWTCLSLYAHFAVLGGLLISVAGMLEVASHFHGDSYILGNWYVLWLSLSLISLVVAQLLAKKLAGLRAAGMLVHCLCLALTFSQFFYHSIGWTTDAIK
jgi:hypothetical protein